MEYVIHLLALFIALNFLLKVGFYPRWGMWTVAAGCAFFAWLVTPWMTKQWCQIHPEHAQHSP